MPEPLRTKTGRIVTDGEVQAYADQAAAEHDRDEAIAALRDIVELDTLAAKGNEDASWDEKWEHAMQRARVLTAPLASSSPS